MKNVSRPVTLALACAIALGAGSAALAQDIPLDTEKQKVSYVVGLQVGGSLTQIKDELDVEVLMAAIRSSLAGEEPLLSQEEAMQVQQAFAQKLQAKRTAEVQEQAAENKRAGEAFLAENKTKEGVQVTESGLQYQVLEQGDGPKPSATDTVKVHYVGTLLDGTEFDSSVARGEPAQFALNAVIPGWTEALQLMPVGSKYRLWIPSELGYGDRGTPGPIGPNATLQFDVELLEIVEK